MRKLLLTIFIIFLSAINVYADNLPNIKYKSIRYKQKIVYDEAQEIWKLTKDKKSTDYYVKTILPDGNQGYINVNDNKEFVTDCDYEFIIDNKLIGYSNKTLNFYEFVLKENEINKKLLSPEEVMFFFLDAYVVKLSDFSENTNSLKIKKKTHELMVILYNDSDNTYEDYVFTSGNAKYKSYDMHGFLTVYKQGMVQFSKNEDKTAPWYVLLIR